MAPKPQTAHVMPSKMRCTACAKPPTHTVQGSCHHLFCNSCYRALVEATNARSQPALCGACGKRLKKTPKPLPHMDTLLKESFPDQYLSSNPNVSCDTKMGAEREIGYYTDAIWKLVHARAQVFSRVRDNDIGAQAEKFFNTSRKYNIIHADCPWNYPNQVFNGGIKGRYSSMTDSEMYSLPVEGLCHPDAVLLFWTTMPKLDIALNTIYSWGFRYTTCFFAWTKIYPKSNKLCAGAGCYTRPNVELCLLGVKGKISLMRQRDACISNALVTRDVENLDPQPEFNRAELFGLDDPLSVEDVIEAAPLYTRRGDHSQKPEEGYEKILKIFGDLPRIDLFARQTRPGWDCFGNQTDAYPRDATVTPAMDKAWKERQDKNYSFLKHITENLDDIWKQRLDNNSPIQMSLKSVDSSIVNSNEKRPASPDMTRPTDVPNKRKKQGTELAAGQPSPLPAPLPTVAPLPMRIRSDSNPSPIPSPVPMSVRIPGR